MKGLVNIIFFSLHVLTNYFFKKKYTKKTMKSSKVFLLSIFGTRRALKPFKHDKYECQIAHLQFLVYNPLEFKINIFYRFRGDLWTSQPIENR